MKKQLLSKNGLVSQNFLSINGLRCKCFHWIWIDRVTSSIRFPFLLWQTSAMFSEVNRAESIKCTTMRWCVESMKLLHEFTILIFQLSHFHKHTEKKARNRDSTSLYNMSSSGVKFRSPSIRANKPFVVHWKPSTFGAVENVVWLLMDFLVPSDWIAETQRQTNLHDSHNIHLFSSSEISSSLERCCRSVLEKERLLRLITFKNCYQENLTWKKLFYLQ